MTAAYVTHAAIPGGYNGGTSAGVDTTGATLLVVSVSWYAGSSRPTLTDSKSNTWVALTQQTLSVPGNVQFYCKNPTVGSGHTFTLAGVSIAACGQVLAFSGTDTSAPFDVESGATNNTFSLQPGSITPSVNGCVIVSGLSAGDGTSGYSIGSGFTITDQLDHTLHSNEGGAAAYLIQSTAAAINPTWSASNLGSSLGVAATIAAFKPAGGGSSKSSIFSLTTAVQVSRSANLSASVAVRATRSVSSELSASTRVSRNSSMQIQAALQRSASASTSLDSAVRSARSSALSVQTAIQTSRSQTANLDAALRSAHQAMTTLDAAVQAARTTNVSASAYVQAGNARAASISVGVQAPRNVSLSASVAVQLARQGGADLSAAVQALHEASSSISAQVQAGTTAAANINTAVQRLLAVSADVSAAVRRSVTASAELSACVSAVHAVSAVVSTAINDPRISSTALSTYVSIPSSGECPTAEEIAAAVLATLNSTAIPVNVKQMNDADVIGDGTDGNPWRGVGVPP